MEARVQCPSQEYYENATLHVTHCKDREFAHPVYNRNNQYASIEDLRNGILSQAKNQWGVCIHREVLRPT